MAIAVDESELMQATDFSVGDWIVRTSHNRLRAKSGGSEISIEPRQSALFLALIRRNGQLATRDDLIAEVWQGYEVSDDSLAQSISRLRKAIGDTSRNSKYIETIWKTGYRWIGPVEPVKLDGNGGVFTPSLLTRFGGAALLVVAGALIWFWVGRPAVPLLIDTLPVAASPAGENSPAVSFNSAYAAYVTMESGEARGDIEIVALSNGRTQRLTREGDNRAPVWSQDDEQIAYMRFDNDHCTIMISVAPFEVSRNVSSCDGSSYPDLTWSSADDRFAYGHHMEAGGPSAIVFAQYGEVRSITSPPDTAWGDFNPEFSRDGEQIVFTRAFTEMRHDLFIVDRASNKERRLTHGEAAILGAAWTPSNDAIIYSTIESGRYQLRSIDVRSGDITPIFVAASDVVEPGINVAGDLIATDRNFDSNIVEVSIETGTAIPASYNSSQWDLSPAMSPDGSKTLFVSDRSGSFGVWINSVDGETVRVMEFDGDYIAAVRFDKQGEGLFVESRRGDDFAIYKVDEDGGNLDRVTPSGTKALAMSLSADGSYIYFASDKTGKWEVWRVSNSGGRVEQVTSDGGYSAAESFDSQYVYFTKAYEDGIWRRNADGTVVKFDERLSADDAGAWTVVDDGLLFLDRSLGDSGALVFIAHTAASERIIYELENPAMRLDRVLYSSPDMSEVRLVTLGDIESDVVFARGVFAPMSMRRER